MFRDTGVEGKLKALHARCGLHVEKKGRRPWFTIVELKRLRDRIAHPRTITVSETIEYVEGKDPPLFAKSWMDGAVAHAKALRALEDVKSIADPLHKAAMARFPHAGLLPGALDGILAMRSGTASLKQE